MWGGRKAYSEWSDEHVVKDCAALYSVPVSFEAKTKKAGRTLLGPLADDLGHELGVLAMVRRKEAVWSAQVCLMIYLMAVLKNKNATLGIRNVTLSNNLSHFCCFSGLPKLCNF